MIRIVIPTVAATLAVAMLAGWLLLQPLLGAFGLVAVPAATFERLQASDRIVVSLRQRNANERVELDRGFAQDAARHVASTTLAAATVGPVAVATATMAVEADRYCERKEALVREAELLGADATPYDRDRCFEDAKRESAAILEEVARTASKAAADAVELSSRHADEAWAKIREAGRQAAEAAAGVAVVAADALREALQEAARALETR